MNDHAAETIAELTRQLKACGARTESLRESVAVEVRKARAMSDGFAAERAQLNQQLAASKADFTSVAEECTRLQKELDSLVMRYESAADQREHYRNELDKAQHSKAELRQTLDAITQVRDQLRDEVQALRKRMAEAKQQRDAWEKDAQARRDEILALCSKLEQAEARLVAAQTQAEVLIRFGREAVLFVPAGSTVTLGVDIRHVASAAVCPGVPPRAGTQVPGIVCFNGKPRPVRDIIQDPQPGDRAMFGNPGTPVEVVKVYGSPLGERRVLAEGVGNPSGHDMTLSTWQGNARPMPKFHPSVIPADVMGQALGHMADLINGVPLPTRTEQAKHEAPEPRWKAAAKPVKTGWYAVLWAVNPDNGLLPGGMYYEAGTGWLAKLKTTTVAAIAGPFDAGIEAAGWAREHARDYATPQPEPVQVADDRKWAPASVKPFCPGWYAILCMGKGGNVRPGTARFTASRKWDAIPGHCTVTAHAGPFEWRWEAADWAEANDPQDHEA